jgi:hypothetical protein
LGYYHGSLAAAAGLKLHADASAAKSKQRLDQVAGAVLLKVDKATLKADQRQLQKDEKAAKAHRK